MFDSTSAPLVSLLAFSSALTLQHLYEKLFYLQKYENRGKDLRQKSGMDIRESEHVFDTKREEDCHDHS